MPRPEVAQCTWETSSHGSSCRCKKKGVGNGPGERNKVQVMRIPVGITRYINYPADHRELWSTVVATHCWPCFKDIFFLQLSSGVQVRYTQVTVYNSLLRHSRICRVCFLCVSALPPDSHPALISLPHSALSFHNTCHLQNSILIYYVYYSLSLC